MLQVPKKYWRSRHPFDLALNTRISNGQAQKRLRIRSLLSNLAIIIISPGSLHLRLSPKRYCGF